jgi:hypothetical protein
MIKKQEAQITIVKEIGSSLAIFDIFLVLEQAKHKLKWVYW